MLLRLRRKLFFIKAEVIGLFIEELACRDGFFAFELISKDIFSFFLLATLIVACINAIEVVVASANDIGLIMQFFCLFIQVADVESVCWLLLCFFKLAQLVVIAIKLLDFCL